jgi:hypothetical protein
MSPTFCVSSARDRNFPEIAVLHAATAESASELDQAGEIEIAAQLRRAVGRRIDEGISAVSNRLMTACSPRSARRGR